MAAPEFVPLKPTSAKAYSSPPRRGRSWSPTRPAEVVGAAQPTGKALGVQGPDQGYALVLANRLRGELKLRAGEKADDVIAGAVGIAMRRASLYGRAPVMHDVRLALNLFGFLSDDPDPALVGLRQHAFEEVSSHHHYFESRELVAMVPEASLRLTPEQVLARTSDWRELLGR